MNSTVHELLKGWCVYLVLLFCESIIHPMNKFEVLSISLLCGLCLCAADCQILQAQDIISQINITSSPNSVGSGTQAQAWWWNPDDNTSVLIGTYATTGTSNFTPGSDRKVLVLDNAASTVWPHLEPPTNLRVN